VNDVTAIKQLGYIEGSGHDQEPTTDALNQMIKAFIEMA